MNPVVSRLALLVMLAMCAVGCMRRRLTIRSDPPGAQVFIDDQEIGLTPVSTSFTYYGVRKIQIIKSGYETLTVLKNIKPPWYEIPPLDFVSENLYPGELRDERELRFQLAPQRITPAGELIQRAEQLRSQTLQPSVQPTMILPGRGPLAAPALGQPPVSGPPPAGLPPGQVRPERLPPPR